MKNYLLLLCGVFILLTSCQPTTPGLADPTKLTVSTAPTTTTHHLQIEQTATSQATCAFIKDEDGWPVPMVDRPSLAYDSQRQKTVLYDGHSGCTWEYDGTFWELIETETSPPSSGSEKLIYDSTQGLIRLVGTFPNWSEVWQYNGIDWQRVIAENSFYLFSSGWVTAAYMPDKQAIYLLGACLEKCSNEGHYSGWLFEGKSWVEEGIIPFGADAAAGEPTYMTPEVVYLEDNQTLVLQTGFGGKTIGSWALNYDGREGEISEDSTSTSGINDLLLFFDMVYDTERKVVVLFGAFQEGEKLIVETWEYDGIEWKQVFPQRSPSVRVWHAMAYDSHRKVVVLYGGSDYTDDNFPNLYETWEYDGVTWTQK